MLYAIDFDDILLKTLNVIQIPQILEEYQERYKYLMIDEYQDTNAPQYEIVKLLAGKYRNLAVILMRDLLKIRRYKFKMKHLLSRFGKSPM